MANAPFPIQPDLTAITLAYRNQALIADLVLPRVPVAKQEFKYTLFPVGDAFTVPDTKVGRTSAPNQVEFGGTEATAATKDYALDAAIPYADIENAAGTLYDPVSRNVEVTTDLILLDREIRVANEVFNAANYGASNKATLAGVTQWSDYANSNPVDAILTAMDAMIMRPNKAVFGQAVWTKLRQHPKVVAAILGGGTTSGVVTREQVAALLELDEIIVGQGWVNSAKKGQTASLARAWGKFAALIYQNPAITPDSGISFGYTAQWGDRISGSWDDSDIGMRGGKRVRVGESLKELIPAGDLGYLFSAAVA